MFTGITHRPPGSRPASLKPSSAPTKTHTLPDGTDYYTINPLGYVPFLTLDDGRSLHEGAAIVQYVADQAPASQLAPANGTFERYKLQEWLNFIATEAAQGLRASVQPRDACRNQSLVPSSA